MQSTSRLSVRIGPAKTVPLFIVLACLSACGGSSGPNPGQGNGTNNQAPNVAVDPDRTILLSELTHITSSSQDDGLPAGSQLTYRWSQLSGPGTAQFSNFQSADVDVSFTASGDYELQLEVSDSEDSGSASLTIHVLDDSDNLAPVVDAGPDQSVAADQLFNVIATVSDDGLPYSPGLSYAWSASGPGLAQFSAPDQPDSLVAFETAGVYLVQFAAFDGRLSASDIARFEVSARVSSRTPQFSAASFIGGPGVGGPGQTIGGESLRHCVVSRDGDLILGGSAVDGSPITPGAFQTTYAGGGYNGDTWVGRMSTDLSMLTAATYIGGSANEREAYNLLERSDGQIVLAGHTDSFDFPTTVGAYDRVHNGGPGDGFVSILSADLSTLTASTYYGGSANDMVRGDLILDANDRVWILGNGESNDIPTVNGWQNSYGGGPNEGFIATFNPDLTTLLRSSYFGGSAPVYSEFVQGGTLFGEDLIFFGTSPSKAFLESNRTIGDAVASDNDWNDLYVGRMHFPNSGPPSLSWFRFFAGMSSDQWAENGIAQDSAGNLYFQALTHGGGQATPGAYDTTFDGPSDCMIVKVSPFGQHIWTTYLGGSGDDHCLAPNINANGDLVLVGQTNSPDFPTSADADDMTINGLHDAFVVILSTDGDELVYSSFYGGADDEFFRWACLSPESNSLFTVGWTRSRNFPVTAGTYQGTFGEGGQDMVIARFDWNRP